MQLISLQNNCFLFIYFQILLPAKMNLYIITKNMLVMFVLLLIIQLGISSPTNSSELETNYTFDDYIIEFNKQYQNQTQYDFRKKIFEKNYQMILELQEENNGDWVSGVNQYTDWTEQEMKKKKGFNYQLGETTHNAFQSISLGSSITLPETYDLRDYQTPVKNQHSCGSCWAFSSTALYESLIYIFTNKTKDLSQQYVLQCTRSGSCAGGLPGHALKIIFPDGIPQQSQYPYKNSDYGYSNICSEQDKIKLDVSLTQIYHTRYVSDEKLKQLLVRYGPISIGIYTPPQFNRYKSGVYSCYNKGRLDHAVLLVGYNKQGWIIKNSWGKTWGMDGYGILDFDYNCGVTQYIDAVILETEVRSILNPGQEQDSSQYVYYIVKMSDSYKDGWHGTQIGIYQNGQIIDSFGKQFTSGATYPDVTVKALKNIEAQLKPIKVKRWTEQISFSLIDKATEKTLFAHQKEGFKIDKIFYTWKPQSQDEEQEEKPTNVTLKLILLDDYGDGWNGNTFKFTQENKTVGEFGEDFKSGHQKGPIYITIPATQQTKIMPLHIGSYRYECQFEIYYESRLIFEWKGNYYQSNTLLGTICPGCPSTYLSHNAQAQEINSDEAKKQEQMEYNNQQKTAEMAVIGYKICLGIVSFICLVSICGLIVVSIKLIRQKNDKSEQQNEKIEKNGEQHTNQQISNGT